MKKKFLFKENIWRLVLLCLAPLVIVAGVVVLKSGFAMKCPFYVHLGILCPGCGMTRALRALLSGQFWESILLNPFALLATVLGILLYVEQWFRFFLKEVHLLPRNKWFYIILCSCLLLYWVLRNIPLFSFLSIA